MDPWAEHLPNRGHGTGWNLRALLTEVTLGQDYLPSQVGAASGITLGLTVSIGGLANPVLALVADANCLQTALATLIVMPVLSWSGAAVARRCRGRQECRSNACPTRSDGWWIGLVGLARFELATA
jgi:hypothetical protein